MRLLAFDWLDWQSDVGGNFFWLGATVMTKKKCGPAFPFEYHNQTQNYKEGFFGTGQLAPGASQQFAGMTLRDYFAAKAMPIIYDQWLKNNWNLFEHPEACEALSNEAYLIADAMLEARK